jgi:hypothetical protein
MCGSSPCGNFYGVAPQLQNDLHHLGLTSESDVEVTRFNIVVTPLPASDAFDITFAVPASWITIWGSSWDIVGGDGRVISSATMTVYGLQGEALAVVQPYYSPPFTYETDPANWMFGNDDWTPRITHVHFGPVGEHLPVQVAFGRFVPTVGCSPAAVALGLRDELAASRPDPDGSGRTERRGYLYQRDDGSYFLQPAFDQTSTMCGFTFDSLPIPPIIPGATFKGDYHTHPSKHLEPLTGCPGQRPGEIMKANRKANVGGGSAGDWDFANLRGKSMYVIDQDGNVWRLDANTLVDNRKNNLNRWRYSGSCLAHP